MCTRFGHACARSAPGRARPHVRSCMRARPRARINRFGAMSDVDPASPADAAHLQTAETVIRGGRQQRKRKLEQLSAQPVQSSYLDSTLVKFLVTKWAWGLFSATECQKIALCSYNDLKCVLRTAEKPESLLPKSLFHLASLGTWGKNPGNFQKNGSMARRAGVSTSSNL